MKARETRRLVLLPAALVAAALVATGCGGDETEATAEPVAESATYEPGSDVAPHAAIGADIAEIQALLEPAAQGEGEEADFEAVGEIWAGGSNSQKSDGTPRTLAGFVEDDPIADRVNAAIEGEGPARRLGFDERRQWIEKGISAALATKILAELDEAAAKIEEGNTGPTEGAPHDVDEAWAFFEAQGSGLAVTAAKRAEDYGLAVEEVEGPVIAALKDAQAAARESDGESFDAAREEVRGALNFIFALAVEKYLTTGVGDGVATQEGLAFSWGLAGLPDEARATLMESFGDLDEDAAERGSAAVDEAAGELAIERGIPNYEPTE